MMIVQSTRTQGTSARTASHWLTALVLVLGVTLFGEARAWTTEGDGAALSEEMVLLLRIRFTYPTANAAIRAGYQPVPGCVADLVAALPVPYAHPRLLEQPLIVEDRPQVLQYEIGSGGGSRLRGVAYRVHQRTWHAAGNVLRPTLFGRQFELVGSADGQQFYLLVIPAIATETGALTESVSTLGACTRAGP